MTTANQQISEAGLQYEERYSVGGLFACLVRADGPHRRRNLQLLKKLFIHLELTPDDQQSLVGLTKGQDDPRRFAAAIREDRTRWMVLWDLLALSIVADGYDAREREGIRRMAAALGVPWVRVTAAEDGMAAQLRSDLKGSAAGSRASAKRWWMIAGATIAGGVALAATGGFAAPAIGGIIGTYFLEMTGAAATSAGLAFLGFGSVAAGGLGMAGGTVAVASLFGAAGGGLAGYKMHRRTGALEEFAFDTLGGNGMHVSIAISGWLSQKSDLTARWTCVAETAQHGEHYALRWESKHLLALGTALASLSGKAILKGLGKRQAARAAKAGARRLAWPTAVLSALDVIDNPWHMAADRAEKAGRHLANLLMDGMGGRRPVTLIGFSLGSRVIFYALESLAEQKAYGIVEHAILMGAAAPHDTERWGAIRPVVAGRLVNAYSTTDWVLRYAYRAAQLQNGAAGIAPIDHPHVENIDVTHIAGGHLAYEKGTDDLLRYIGFDAPPPN